MKEFIQGLIETIKKGRRIGDTNENGKAYVVWKNIIGIFIGWPIIFYVTIMTISLHEFTVFQHVSNFISTYFAFFISSMLLRLVGVNYIGTYIYNFQFIICID